MTTSDVWLARPSLDEQRGQVERQRASIHLQSQVTLLSIGGDPMRCATVVGERPDGTGFVLGDGASIVFKEYESRGWIFGEWHVNGAESDLMHARASAPYDAEVAAVMSGRWLGDGTIEGLDAPRLPVPRRVFTARTDRWPRGGIERSASRQLSRIMETVLPGATYGVLLAYMIRRFGYPTITQDDYKCLCGGWLLNTPDSRLFIEIAPSVAGVDFSIRRAMTRSTVRELELVERGWVDVAYGRSSDTSKARDYIEWAGPLYRAARIAMLDLLRPVGIRDQLINAEGKVDDDYPSRPVKAARTATYGMPTKLIETEGAWFDVMHAIRQLHRSPKAAMARALEKLTAPEP